MTNINFCMLNINNHMIHQLILSASQTRRAETTHLLEYICYQFSLPRRLAEKLQTARSTTHAGRKVSRAPKQQSNR
jgi:hypothetical protein